MENPQKQSVRPTEGFLLGSRRSGTKARPFVALSVLLSAMAVAAVGCLCALTYPIVKELRAQRVNGTEEKMLGFWSITVLSVLVGCICGLFSWTLTYFDSFPPNMAAFPAPLATRCFRDGSGHGFLMGYGVTILNGIMAMITIIWSLN